MSIDDKDSDEEESADRVEIIKPIKPRSKATLSTTEKNVRDDDVENRGRSNNNNCDHPIRQPHSIKPSRASKLVAMTKISSSAAAEEDM